MGIQTTALIWLLAAVIATGAGEHDQRAATVIGWIATDNYFKTPTPLLPDGSPAPTLGAGALVDHPTRPTEKQRWNLELDQQAEILSMCGEDGLKDILGALEHKEFYVRAVAALALNRMLSVHYAPNFASLTEKDGLWIVGPERSSLVKKYWNRAKQCYPNRF